jgi:hypothetical protein
MGSLTKCLVNRRHLVRLLLTSFVVVTFLPANNWAGECSWCKRTVVVKAISLSDPSFTATAVIGWLSPLLSSPCVSVNLFGAASKPEYILVVRFEADPKGKFPNLDGTFTSYGEIRGAGSIMTIVLFGAFGDLESGLKNFGAFGREVPDYGCLVKSARTEDKGLSWEAHKNQMMEQLEDVLPLENFLRGWENTPTKVQIQPQKEDLDPGQEIDIRVTDFRDKSGRPMKTDCNPNRILFKTEKGKILNTEVSLGTAEDPKLMAYPVDLIAWKDEYVIKYKALNDRCSEDTIFVYNSCDILNHDVLPLEQTRKKDLIGKKKIRIGCYRWDLMITSSSEERYRYDYARGVQNIRHADDEVISAKVSLPLAFDYSLDVPNAGQRWEYYHVLSRDLSYFSATSNSERYNRSNYGDYGAETTHTVHKTVSDAKIDTPFLNDVVILVFDKKSQKAVKATIPLYGISYTWHVEDTLKTVQWSPKTGERIKNKENPRKENVNYYMKPVEDPIPDPTVNPDGLKDYVGELFRQRGLTPPADIPVKTKKKESKIHPDFLIKSGDGVATFGGEGKKTKFRPDSPGSTRREEKIFRWELKRTKKEGN